MIVLGIESSCDETGVGIINLDEHGNMEILANTVEIGRASCWERV